MKLPNKVITYQESVLSKFTIVLDTLVDNDISMIDLYLNTKKHFSDISEFIETIDSLFALNKLEYIEELEVLHYVG